MPSIPRISAAIAAYLYLSLAAYGAESGIPPLTEAEEKVLVEKAKFEGDKAAVRKLIASGSAYWFASTIADVKKSGNISDDQVKQLSAYPDDAFKRLASGLLESDKDTGFRIINIVIAKNQPTLAAAHDIALRKRQPGTHDYKFMAPIIFSWLKERPGNDQVICDGILLLGNFKYKEASPWLFQKQQIGDNHLIQVWERFADRHKLTDAQYLAQLSVELSPHASDIVIADVATEALMRIGSTEHVDALKKTYGTIKKWRLDDVESARLPGYEGTNLYQESLQSYADTLRSTLSVQDHEFLALQLEDFISPENLKNDDHVWITAQSLYRFMAKEGQPVLYIAS